MNKQLIVRVLGLGVLSWLIPFLASFLFFRPGGEMTVPYATFKSIITVVGVTTGCYLLYRYFAHVQSDFVRHGLVVGLTWILLNLILDAAFLMPMAGIGFIEYLTTIGISYLAMLPIAMSLGYALESRMRKPVS